VRLSVMRLTALTALTIVVGFLGTAPAFARAIGAAASPPVSALAAGAVTSYQVAGTITCEGGAAVGDATLAFFPFDGGSMADGWTDSNGHYSVLVDPGSYRIEIWGTRECARGWYSASASGHWALDERDATPVVVAATDTTGVDMALPVRWVTGTVRDTNGDTVEGAVVDIVTWRDARVQGDMTDALGHFSAAVGPGSYAVTISLDAPQVLRGWYSTTAPGHWVGDWREASTFSVGAVGPDPLEITLPAQHLTGHVTGRDGKALPNVELQAWTSDEAASAWTDDTGYYSMSIGPGTYQLQLCGGSYSAIAPGYWTTEWTIATPLSIGSSDRTGVDIEVAALPARRIDGRVTGLGSEGVPDVGVYASEVGGSRWGAATTDASGAFSMAVAPGSYEVTVSTDSRSYGSPGWYSVSSPGHWTGHAASASSVDVTAADVSGVDIALPSVRIRGTVHDVHGGAVGGVSVQSRTASGEFGQGAITDSAGRFDVAVGPGDYLIQFWGYPSGNGSGWFSRSAPGSLSTTRAAASPVLVEATDVPGIDVVLPVAHHVAGIVRTSGGLGLAGMSVVAQPIVAGQPDPVRQQPGDAGSVLGAGESTATARDGTFTVQVTDGVPYTLYLFDPLGHHVDGWYLESAPGQQTVDFGAATVLAPSADLTGVEITLPVITTFTVPTAPRDVSATPGYARVDVTWNAPADYGGAPIDFYDVTSDPPSSVCIVPGEGGGTFGCDMGQLTNGQAYTFSVTARNRAGSGPASSPSLPAAPRTIPGAPTGVTASKAAGGVMVAWTPPSDNGGAAVDKYSVASSPSGGGCTAMAPATSCTATGLVGGLSYSFTVRAHNTAGNGPASGSTSPLVQVTPPGRPTITSVTPGNGQVTVAWTAPSDNGGAAIDTYTAVVVGDATKSCATATTSCTVSGLSNSTGYTFTVTAHNAAGSGPASATSGSVTPTPDPAVSVPAAALVAGGTTAGASIPVRLSWSATSTGSGITAYTLEQSDDGGTSWHAPLTALPSATATSVTLNLPAGSSRYEFRVTAADAAGRSATATGALFTLTFTQDSAKSVKYAKTWKKVASKAASGGTLRTTVVKNASATFTISGRTFAIIAAVGAKHGKALVYDGKKLLTTIDLRASKTAYQKIVYVRSFATSGKHVIKIVCPATRGRPTIDLDAFVVMN
jgi:hypothetical protein